MSGQDAKVNVGKNEAVDEVAAPGISHSGQTKNVLATTQEFAT